MAQPLPRRRRPARWSSLALLVIAACSPVPGSGGAAPLAGSADAGGGRAAPAVPTAPGSGSVPGDTGLVLDGRVTEVVDGDTAWVRLDSGPIEVRFYGVDAPEGRAPFGREAKQSLERRIAGRRVEVVPVEQDQYERMVAVVLADGESVNEAILADGLGWAYRNYLGQVPGDERYCELEAAARAARRGLWSQPPERWVPPWIYRRRAKAPPGAQVPSRDYSAETAADCAAAVRAARHRRRATPASAATHAARAVGAGSAATQPPQSAPSPRCDIKGNINDKGVRIYHVPGGEHYADTRIDAARGERWFCSEAEARAAGWRAAR
jgi:endonuclease YncB( thermonuclease family)